MTLLHNSIVISHVRDAKLMGKAYHFAPLLSNSPPWFSHYISSVPASLVWRNGRQHEDLEYVICTNRPTIAQRVGGIGAYRSMTNILLKVRGLKCVRKLT
jgi:hypothetical protein